MARGSTRRRHGLTVPPRHDAQDVQAGGGRRSDYLHELVAEQLLGEPLEGFSSGMMERGRDMEAEAVEWYGFVRDVTPERVGLCGLCVH